MPTRLIDQMNSTRLDTYRNECAQRAGIPASQVKPGAVADLYVWQTALSAAWFEDLAYAEPILRHSMDSALRTWNVDRTGSADWLRNPDPKLKSLVKKAASDALYRANKANQRRPSQHPRKNAPVTLDDLIAQLSFGTLTFLLPVTPPGSRGSFSTGYNHRENLWLSGLDAAFPNLNAGTVSRWLGGQNAPQMAGVPRNVLSGYAVGQVMDRLVRLRNRIGHHEQILAVNHSRMRKDMTLLLRAVHPAASDGLKRIDRLPRLLAMRSP